MKRLILHTDGAAKGNPGPAGIGVVLYREGEEEPIAAIGESIGTATNNVAEYRALLRGLSEALLHGADAVEVRTDSELMARQITGRYRVTSPLLLPLFEEARRLLARFDKVQVTHVLRGKNALADKLANQGVAEGRAAKGKKREAVAAGQDEAESETRTAGEAEEKPLWTAEQLRELSRDLPVETVSVSSLAQALDASYGFRGGAPTWRAVAEAARCIHEADLASPLLLAPDGVVVEGMERLAKAWLLGEPEVTVVRLPADPEPADRGAATAP